jgi:hypothetical protein
LNIFSPKSFLLTRFIRWFGLLQKGLHLLFACMFVGNEFLRRFQRVVTYFVLERICPLTSRQVGSMVIELRPFQSVTINEANCQLHTVSTQPQYPFHRRSVSPRCGLNTVVMDIIGAVPTIDSHWFSSWLAAALTAVSCSESSRCYCFELTPTIFMFLVFWKHLWARIPQS